MPLPTIFLLNPLIALVLMLPISIGGIGVSQAAYPFFYGLAGVPPSHALAVSLLMQAIMIVGSLPGAVFWLRGRQRQPAEQP
jgi:glycosyltransferase 2 family protein